MRFVAIQALRGGRSVEEAIEVLVISSDEDEAELPAAATAAAAPHQAVFPAMAAPANEPFSWAVTQISEPAASLSERLSQRSQQPMLQQSQQGSTAQYFNPATSSQSAHEVPQIPVLATQASQAGSSGDLPPHHQSAAAIQQRPAAAARASAAVSRLAHEHPPRGIAAAAADARAPRQSGPAPAAAPAQPALPPPGEQCLPA